jgi:transposase
MSDTELTSMPEPARRIEIFTGSGRRRAWSAAAKAEIVAQIGVEGASVSAVARRHGLTPGQLFAWRREARRATVPSGFVPVVSETQLLAPALPKKGRPRAKSSPLAAGASRAAVEVAIGEAVIRVLPGADERTIAAVLSALKLVR